MSDQCPTLYAASDDVIWLVKPDTPTNKMDRCIWSSWKKFKCYFHLFDLAVYDINIYSQITLITASSDFLGWTLPMLCAVQYITLPFWSFWNNIVRLLLTSKSDPSGWSDDWLDDEVSETVIFCLYQVMFDIGLLRFAKQLKVFSFFSFTSTTADGDKMTSETGTIKIETKKQKASVHSLFF